MHYYIDGYNLLFRMLHTGDDLKTQRSALIDDLAAKINFLGLEATLVFDSHYQPEETSRSHIDHLEIVFTAVGETADEFILQEIKEARGPSQETVVTSDKKLAWLCRRRLAKSEPVEEFLAWLNKRCKNKRRIQKTPIKSKVQVALEKPSPPKKTPQLHDVPEKCFDYYLETFEKESAEIVVSEAAKKQERRGKKGRSPNPKSKKAPVTPEEAYKSDMERWLRAFEN